MKQILVALSLCFIVFNVFSQYAEPELILPSGHTKMVTSVTYSPDGKHIFTGSSDFTIREWSADDGRELRVFRDAKSTIFALRFSPDGKLFAAGCADGRLLIWDINSGLLQHTIKLHTDTITSIDFFSNTQILSGGKDRTAKIYDLKKKAVVSTILERRFKIKSVAYYPAGDFIATGGGGVDLIGGYDSSDQPAKLWDISGNNIVNFEFGVFNTSTEIDFVGFSANGEYLCAVGWGQGRIYDLTNKNRLIKKFNAYADYGMMSADKKSFLIGSSNSLQLFEVPGGKLIRKFKDLPPNITSAALSPKGDFITVGITNNAAVILDALTGEIVRPLESRSGGILAVTFSPYGKYLATGSMDGTAKIWDVETGELVKVTDREPYRVSSLAFSPDNKSIAVGNLGNYGKLYDISTGKALYNFYGGGSALTFSPGGERFLAINKTEPVFGIYLYDTASGKPVSKFSRSIMKLSFSRWNTCAVFSPDGKYVYVAGKKNYPLQSNDKIKKAFGEIEMWDTETGKLINTLPDNHDEIILSMDISKDGKNLVTGSNDKSIWFWNRILGRRTSGYNLHQSAVSALSYSPDGNSVLTAGHDGAAKIFDLNQRTSISFTGHTSELYAARYAPSGKYIVTGSLDNTTRIWDVKTGKELAKLIPIDISEWLIITPEGYFDGSEKALKTLYYSYRSTTIPLELLKPRYYKKGLLPILLGYRPGTIPNIRPFSSGDVYPVVKLNETINPENPVINVQLVDNGGGIGKLSVYINGKLAIPDARGNITDKTVLRNGVAQVQISLQKSDLLVRGQKNTVEFRAFNAANNLCSPGVSVSFDAPQRIK